MNKTDLLLQMLEHPQAYSADEWQQILLDEECRELYTLMSKTRSAIDAARADEQITDQVIDEEWQRFEAHSSLHTPHTTLRKLAASFIGLLLVSGIALAAVQIVRNRAGGDLQSPTQEVLRSNSHQPAVPADTLTADTNIKQTVTFDDVLFDQMLSEIADYYHSEAVFQNEEARQLRFYFVWYQDQPLDKVVETLNHFESVNIVMDDKKLIVR
ncbi:MAG: DUF4974 domain-containing protein [Prevotella sp.]|nr:DUF4974 domain-containing protein [Prevotella sp.]